MKSNPRKISLIQVYAPTADSKKEEINTSYDDIEKASQKNKSDGINMVMGDLNAKVREGSLENTVEEHSWG